MKIRDFAPLGAGVLVFCLAVPFLYWPAAMALGIIVGCIIHDRQFQARYSQRPPPSSE